MKGKKYSVKESRRKYIFIGANVELEDVTEIIVSSSNNHRLKTANGKLHIVAPNWIHIEITSDEDWVF